jgi:hypothetical protein
VVLGFELEVSYLLDRHLTTWALFALVIFLDRVSLFCLGQPEMWSAYLYLLCSWDYRNVPSCPAFFLLKWGLVNILPELALHCDTPNCHLSSSWDYRHEPPCLAELLISTLNFGGFFFFWWYWDSNLGPWAC